MIILNERIAELVGAIIGDGCIRYRPDIPQYYVEIVGDKIKEKDYFEYLTKIIKEELKLNVSVKIRGRGLRLKTCSKELLEYLVFSLALPCNKDKGKKVTIPKNIIENHQLLIPCLRGIFDTDGSIFFANKGYRKDYPTIEINTTSENLAQQLSVVLSHQFRIGFRKHQRGRFLCLYKISLNGELMVKKWFEEIGSSNSKNLIKFKKWECGDLNSGVIPTTE